MKISKETITNRIKSYAVSNYKKLDIKDFILGEAPYNYKCHLNAVQKVKEGKAEKVFMCLAIDTEDNDFQCVHFINQLEDGKYQDNTWGWRYKQCEYYIIKEINSDEQEHIWDSLCECKRMLVNTNSTAFERFIFKIKAEKFI